MKQNSRKYFPQVSSVMKLFLAVLFLGLFSSCDDVLLERTTVTFDSPFPKKDKNLAAIWGDKLSLVKNSDTIPLKITYGKDGKNLIVDLKRKDTVFYGTVCKYRGLLFFSEQVNDSSYVIFTAKKTGNLLYGLNVKNLQTFYLREIILKGDYKNLISYMSPDSSVIRLHPEKKQLKKIFSELLRQFKINGADTILQSPDQETPDPITDLISENTNADNDESEFISKIYPNPFHDFLNVDLEENGNLFYSVSDMNGKKIMNGRFTGNANKLETGHLNEGTYLLNVFASDNNFSETYRVVKSK